MNPYHENVLTFSNNGNNFYIGFDEEHFPDIMRNKKFVPEYDSNTKVICIKQTNHGGLAFRKVGGIMQITSATRNNYIDLPISGPIRIPLIKTTSNTMSVLLPQVLPPPRYRKLGKKVFHQDSCLPTVHEPEVKLEIMSESTANVAFQVASGQMYSFNVPENELITLMLSMSEKGYRVD